MKRLRFEFVESCKIAYAQIAANRTRSFLTALGVIIGIVAVTLMGTAINGIDTGFNRSMALLGDDILYVSKHPWASDRDDWEFRNRREIKSEYAERLQTIIDATRGSQLLKAVPTATTFKNVVRGDYEASNVFTLGTVDEYANRSTPWTCARAVSSTPRKAVAAGTSACWAATWPTRSSPRAGRSAGRSG